MGESLYAVESGEKSVCSCGSRQRQFHAEAKKSGPGRAHRQRGKASAAAEGIRHTHAAKDQHRQIEQAEELDDKAQQQKRQRRMRVMRIDELDEKRHKKQNRLGVEQTDEQGFLKRVFQPLSGLRGVGMRLRRLGMQPGVRRMPALPGRAQHIDAQPTQIQRSRRLNQVIQGQIGFQQRGCPGCGQHHQHRVAQKHPERPPIALANPALRRHTQHIERVRPGQQDDEDHPEHIGPQIDDAEHVIHGQSQARSIRATKRSNR